MSSHANTNSSAINFGLLLLNGSLLALMLPLAKLATNAGLSPVAFAFWQTLGAGFLLLALSRKLPSWLTDKRVLRYCLLSGATGIAYPNALAFFLVGKVGPGFTSTLYAFPPIFTLLFAFFMRLERPNCQRIVGIIMACLGCFWIVMSQGELIPLSSLYWYLLGLVVPIFIAIGNVYRTFAWPAGTAPVSLAAGMMLSASVWLLLIDIIDGSISISLSMPVNIQGLVALQAVITALTYLGVFELQKRSSPVFLSQMGCVGALVGLLIGILCFNETYAIGVWFGVAVVLAGLLFANRPRKVRKQIDTSRILLSNSPEL